MQSIPLLKKHHLPIFLGFLLLVLTVLPLSAILPACNYWERRPTLANGAELNVDAGFFIRGSFAKIVVLVYGGDKQITAHLMDPSGNILQQERIETSSVFHFGVSNDGHYSLYLENDFKLSEENDEQILVKVYYSFYRILFWASGTALLIIGFAPVVYHKLKPARETFDAASFDSEYVTFLKLKKPGDALKAVARTECIQGLLKWVDDKSATRAEEFKCKTDNLANVLKMSFPGDRYVLFHFIDKNQGDYQAFLSVKSLRKLVKKIQEIT